MKPIVATLVAVLFLAGVGFAVYPSAHGSYVRHRAAAHLRDAETLQGRMTSPVAKQALGGSGDQLKFALMRSDTALEDIVQFDASLVRLMASLKASPPPDNPIEVTAVVEPSVTAGDTMTVRVSLHSLLPQVFLVNVTAQVGLQQGWQSSPARKIFNRAIDGTPIETPLEFQIPADVSGAGRVRATVTYRLDPTGEGMDLRAQPSATPALTIARGRK